MPRNAVTNRLAIRDYPSSLGFNGTSTVVNCGTVLAPGTSDVSVACYFKTLTSPTTLQALVCRQSNLAGASTAGYSLFIENGILRSAFGDATNLARRDSSSKLASNTWYFGVITYSFGTGTINLYLNGIADQIAQTGTAPTGSLTGSNSLIFGSDNGSRRFLNGNLSDVMIWNRALSASEVSSLYFSNIIPTGGTGRWKMIDGAGTTATDSISGNNGTITSGTFTYDSPAKARRQINGNKVINGDFEYAPPFTAITNTVSSVWVDGTAAGSATNDLFGWYKITGVNTFAASFDSTVKNSGNYSLKLEATDATGRGRALSAPFETSTTAALIAKYGIPVKPSTDYDLSAYIRTASVSASSVRIQVLYYNVDGTQSGSSNTAFQSSTQAFTQVTLRFTTGTSTGYIVLKLDDNTASGGAHQCWFDDVSVVPVFPEGRVPANGNLVKNFDFEVVPTFVANATTAARWMDGTAGGSTTNGTYKWALLTASAGVTAKFDSSVAHSGTTSMKVSTNGTGQNAAVANAVDSSVSTLQAYAIKLNPGTSYTGTFWMKTNYVSGDSSDGATVQFCTRNASGSLISTNQATVVKTTTDWTQYSVTFTPGNTEIYCTPKLLVTGSTGTGTLIMDAWFDDLYLAPTTNPGRVAIT